MGKNNRGRGSPRGGPGSGRGGRGGPRGRGRGGFRGRGRGGGPPNPMAGAQQGGYHTLAEMDQVYLIAEDRNYKPPSGTSTPNRGRGSRGGRGSGPGTPARGGYGFRGGRGRGLIDDFFSPSPSKRGHGGIGDRSPRGRGGFSKGFERLRSDAPLSDLLHQERPLLRPVVFVRSTLTATLFEEEEEIFRAGVEDIGDGEQSHQPTADRVFRLFSGTHNIPPIPISEDDSEAEVEEQLEEIDFNETEKLLDPTTTTIIGGSNKNASKDVEIIEERFTGIYINRDSPPTTVVKEEEEAIVVDGDCTTTLATSTVVIESSQEEPMNVDLPTTSTSPPPPAPSAAPAQQEEQPLFYIDTTPTSITDLPPPLVVPSDDEEIVYVAPHPRGERERETPARKVSPLPSSVLNPTGKVQEAAPVFQTTSVLTGTTLTAASTTSLPASTSTPAAVPTPPIPTTSSLTLSFPTQPPSRPRQIPAFSAGGRTKAAVKQRQRDKRAERRRVEKAEASGKRGFGKGGRGGRGGGMGMGMRGGLVEEARLTGEDRRDKRWKERRRGDSDVDWGTDDDVPSTHLPSSLHPNIYPNDTRSGEDLAGEAEGMLVDPDISLDAMKAFVRGMGVEGGRFVSMDDVRDEEMLRREDEEELEGENGAEGSSAEEDDDDVEDNDEGDKGEREGGGQGEGEESGEETEEEGGKELDEAVEKEEELMIAEELILELPPDSGEDEMNEEDEVSDDDDDELDEGEVEVDVDGVGGGGEDDGEDDEGEEGEEEGEEDDDEDDDEDIDLSPGASFQARLERLRAQSRKTPSKAGLISNGKGKGKGKGRMEVVNDSDEDEEDEGGEDEDGEDDEDEEYRNNLSWAERDEEFIAHIQDIMDENEAALTGRERKARKRSFTAIRNGDFDDMDGFKVARKKKDKYKDLPPSLISQWEKDRAKKAEYKKAKQLAKLEAAADPLIKKKGGKKGRKTMATLRSLSPSLVVLPNRIISLPTLVTQIRRFISNLSGPTSMPLPPTNKETRKAIHELATAFGLNSKSEGRGEGRYTVLKKTSRCGEGRVDERKVGRIVRRFEGSVGGGGEFLSGAEWKEKNKVGKHKEGDEVGKHAPKIGEANMGFQLLSRMGWSEGDRIGVTGGLEAPITALFKTSKLGLGATR